MYVSMFLCVLYLWIKTFTSFTSHVKWSINWDSRMGLGSCGYDENGLMGGCNLGESVIKQSVSR